MVMKSNKTPKKTMRNTPAIELLERGIKQLHEKEYKSARGIFHEILEKHAEEKDVAVRAVAYLRSCEARLASTKPSARTAEDFYNLGIVKHNQEEHDAAIELFSESLKLDHKGDHICYALAASYAMKNDLASAVKNLEQAIKINKDNIIFARNDADFDSIRKEKEFTDLVGTNPE